MANNAAIMGHDRSAPAFISASVGGPAGPDGVIANPSCKTKMNDCLLAPYRPFCVQMLQRLYVHFATLQRGDAFRGGAGGG
jgi:hypothetical protein